MQRDQQYRVAGLDHLRRGKAPVYLAGLHISTHLYIYLYLGTWTLELLRPSVSCICSFIKALAKGEESCSDKY